MCALDKQESQHLACAIAKGRALTELDGPDGQADRCLRRN